MNRRKASVAAVVTTAALVATPTLASTANAELSPTNVLNVLGIPLQNANQVIQAGNVKTGDTKDGKDVITNLPNAIFAALVNQGAVGDTAELQKRLASYFGQSTTNFGKLPADIVNYDTAAISKLFAPAPLAANVATVKAVNAPVTSAASSPLDLLGLPLQLATNALQAFNVELRDASGKVIVKDGSATTTNVANAIFKAVVDLGATGNWGALANNIGLYLAQFGTNIASGKFVSQKPTVAPAASGVTSAQVLTVAAKGTTPEVSPADAGLVGDLLNVAGIPLQNANQVLKAFVVDIAWDKDNKPTANTNVVNAIFKAVVELGFTGKWGDLATAVTGYVAQAAGQVAALPANIISYDTKAITNVFNGGLAPAPSAQTTATPGGSVSTSGKALSLPAAAATGSGSDGNLGTGSQAAAAAATADAPTAPAAPTSSGGSKGKGVDLFEKFAEALGGGKNGPTTGGGTTGGGSTGGGTTGGGSTGGGTTGGGSTGGGSTGGGTTGGGTTGGGTTGGGTTGGDTSGGAGDAGGAK